VVEDSSTEQPRQNAVPHSWQLLVFVVSKDTPHGHAPFMGLLLGYWSSNAPAAWTVPAPSSERAQFRQ
jgi:hypothetical protein